MKQALTAVVLRLARRELSSMLSSAKESEHYASLEAPPDEYTTWLRDFHRTQLPLLQADVKFWEDSVAELEADVRNAERAEETAGTP